MGTSEIFEKVVSSFERYYNIKRENILPPFTAEAEFKSHNEQYVLVKAAKIADIDSNDFVYFKLIDNTPLTENDVSLLSETAWNAGLQKVHPSYGHRNSDVTVIILADQIDEAASRKIKKTKFSKSYKLGLYGWSNFRLCAMELSSGQIFCNRLGGDLKKILANTKKSFLKGENK